MRAIKLLFLASIAVLLIGSAALNAYGYELLYPLHKWGDPDEPVEYRLNISRNEVSVPGDAEFDDVRASFQNWEDVGTRLAFYEGPNHGNCDFAENGLNEVAFDECGGECTGACIAVTRSITDAVVDQMWQEGPDGTIKVRAKVLRARPFPETYFGEDISWGKLAIERGHALAYAPAARVIHSHDRSAGYEFRRTVNCHARLHELFGLETVPRLSGAFSGIVRECLSGLSDSLALEEAAMLPRREAARALGQYFGARLSKLGLAGRFHFRGI